MNTPLPNFPPKALAAIAVVLALAGCQPGSTPRPVPSVPQIGGDLKCSANDHGYEDPQAGWGFCYPNTWKYTERSQATTSPPGLDLTFDITCLSDCKTPCPSATTSGQAQCSPESGLFAFMILSTYERGSSPDLASWIQSDMPKAAPGDTISWGNASEAVKLADGRRVALTPHHVVVMDLHSGLLDLETEMGSRLDTWKFTF